MDMTQEAVIKYLIDGKWHATSDIYKYGGAKTVYPLAKRGEICKRTLWIPEERRSRGKVIGLKITKIVQYRIHPEWLEIHRRKYGE
jgi:hypothetical protein